MVTSYVVSVKRVLVGEVGEKAAELNGVGTREMFTQVVEVDPVRSIADTLNKLNIPPSPYRPEVKLLEEGMISRRTYNKIEKLRESPLLGIPSHHD